MATWIFQGNPDRFDIDGYLAADLESITWLVRQHRDQIAVGDTVFLWKALGEGKGAYFSPSWTAFQAERGRDFSLIVDAVSTRSWTEGVARE